MFSFAGVITSKPNENYEKKDKNHEKRDVKGHIYRRGGTHDPSQIYR